MTINASRFADCSKIWGGSVSQEETCATMPMALLSRFLPLFMLVLVAVLVMVMNAKNLAYFTSIYQLRQSLGRYTGMRNAGLVFPRPRVRHVRGVFQAYGKFSSLV